MRAVRRAGGHSVAFGARLRPGVGPRRPVGLFPLFKMFELNTSAEWHVGGYFVSRLKAKSSTETQLLPGEGWRVGALGRQEDTCEHPVSPPVHRERPAELLWSPWRTNNTKRKVLETLCHYRRARWGLAQARILDEPAETAKSDEQLRSKDIAVDLELASSVSNSSQFRSSLWLVGRSSCHDNEREERLPPQGPNGPRLQTYQHN